MNFWDLDRALTEAARAETAARGAYARSRSNTRGAAWQAASAAYDLALATFREAEPRYRRAERFRAGRAALAAAARRPAHQLAFNI